MVLLSRIETSLKFWGLPIEASLSVAGAESLPLQLGGAHLLLTDNAQTDCGVQVRRWLWQPSFIVREQIPPRLIVVALIDGPA